MMEINVRESLTFTVPTLSCADCQRANKLFGLQHEAGRCAESNLLIKLF